MPFFSVPAYLAGGNISPSRFVIGSSVQDYWVTQAAAASTRPFGISHEYVRYAPGTPFDDGFAATASQQIPIYGDTELCPLESGASFAAGQYLKSDGNGRGIPVTTGTYYGARALAGASASGQRVRVQVCGGYLA